MDTEYPTISVMVATYDGGKRIADCLDSITAQDYPKNRLEILVVLTRSSNPLILNR